MLRILHVIMQLEKISDWEMMNYLTSSYWEPDTVDTDSENIDISMYVSVTSLEPPESSILGEKAEKNKDQNLTLNKTMEELEMCAKYHCDPSA